MPQSVVPEHDVTGPTVAVYRSQAVVVLANGVVLVGRLVAILRGVGAIEGGVAARPDGKAAAVGWHVVYIADHAEVKRVRIAVTLQRGKWRLPIGQGAVDTANALRFAQLAHPQHLLGHFPYSRVFG